MPYTIKSVRFGRSRILLTALIAGLIGCGSAVPNPIGPSLNLSSLSIASGYIPDRFSSCRGQSNISPALSWEAAPADTKSLALIVYDKDSPFGANFVHWMLYDLPPMKTSLAEGTPKKGGLSDGSRQGLNGFGDTGYAGPCPPGQSPHHYVFNLYALDTTLEIPPGSPESQLVKALKGHIIAGGQLTAIFPR